MRESVRSVLATGRSSPLAGVARPFGTRLRFFLVPPDTLDQLHAADWDQLFPDLVAFASWRAVGLPFTKGGGELPQGYEPKDLAREAVTRVFEGRRVWDPARDPDLLDYLKGVVSSLASNLVTSADHARRTTEGNGEAIDLDTFSDVSPTPAALAASAECEEELRDLVEEATADDPGLAAVAMGLEDGMRAAEIASEFSMEVGDVYGLTQKLRRRLLSSMSARECWEDHPLTTSTTTARR